VKKPGREAGHLLSSAAEFLMRFFIPPVFLRDVHNNTRGKVSSTIASF
jgi:hypothetical protein